MTIRTYRMYRDAPELFDTPQKWVDFPGGEQHVDYVHDGTDADIQIIRWDGADAADFIRVAMWADAVNRRVEPDTRIALMLPYLPGARMDRGAPLGAKVYADLINSLEFDAVVAVDPHSDVMPALLDNLKLVQIPDILEAGNFQAAQNMHELKYSAVIIPDAGAGKRATAVADWFGIPTIQALKHRDFATGTLSGFKLTEKLMPGGRYLVVDDMCDGGGTFAGLLSTITASTVATVDLWVTHGIFSGQAGQKLIGYDTIYTTNSHPGHANSVMFGLDGTKVRYFDPQPAMAKAIWKALR